MFISGNIAITFIFVLLGSVMVVTLFCAYSRLENLLALLEDKGLSLSRKTLCFQVICLVCVAALSLVTFVTKIIYTEECLDPLDAYSTAGLVSRSANLAGMMFWRAITVTMCIFLMRNALNLSQVEI